jgi:hypothetical protein
LASIVSGFGFFYSPKQSWLISVTTSNRLKALKSKIEFSGLDEDRDIVRAFHDEYQAILDIQNKAWLELRSEAPPIPPGNLPVKMNLPAGLTSSAEGDPLQQGHN